MSFHNNPTVRGPGLAKPFKTRTPVGKLGNKFKNIPRVGVSIPLFGNRPKPIEQLKANTPAFRGPAKLPTGFIKSTPTGNFSQSGNRLAQLFNGPLRLPRPGLHGVPKLGLHGVPQLGHGKTVRRKVKKRSKKK